MRRDLGHKIVMIDPTECGSTVAYSIFARRADPSAQHVSATVDLADCTRKIQWYFSGRDADPLGKIDAAIKLLRDFREDWIRATSELKPKPKLKPLRKK